MTKDEFVKRSREIYGNKYDYRSIQDGDLQPYMSVPIYCDRHGLFYQTVYFHLQGIGCCKCAYTEKR